LADGSNLYLATVIDCCSRKLAGWAVADHMRTELVENALNAARLDRGSLKGAIFHSDHGAVYTSKDYARLCRAFGVTQSMGAVGSCRQRLGRVVQRHAETRSPRRSSDLRRRG
jgi:transposase InsO family protein